MIKYAEIIDRDETPLGGQTSGKLFENNFKFAATVTINRKD